MGILNNMDMDSEYGMGGFMWGGVASDRNGEGIIWQIFKWVVD